MTVNPEACFPQFYTNPAIRLLECFSRWTVSGRLETTPGSRGKAPIDMRALLDTGRVRGAWAVDQNCLVTLGELSERLPAAVNAAFYLRAQTDGLLVIDIEPGCPEGVAANLLALPGVLYAEISMSGRGYHLLTRLPENFFEHRLAAGKRVLREPHGWYEILLDHWITFTRQPIREDVLARARTTASASAPFTSVDDLYASLAETARASTAAAAVITSPTFPEVSGSREIIELTLAGARLRFKTLDEFDGDNSRFEFSVLGVLFREMRHHLVRYGFVHRVNYSPDDRAWLLYQAALQALPSRQKHSERRNGRPFLLDRAAAMVAAS